jgi:hypothetical protein
MEPVSPKSLGNANLAAGWRLSRLGTQVDVDEIVLRRNFCNLHLYYYPPSTNWMRLTYLSKAVSST